MRDFRDLDVWHEARRLAVLVYEVARRMLPEEMFEMTSQLRRAAVSVSTNIAEGCGRGTQGDLARFVEIAMGSATEVESVLVIAQDVGLLTESDCQTALEQVIRVKKMLSSLVGRFPRRASTPPRRLPAGRPPIRPVGEQAARAPQSLADQPTSRRADKP
jgi:four helix bundle protein